MDTTIYAIFTIIFMIGMGYYTIKLIQYRFDERGKAIICKSAYIVFAAIIVIFSTFTLYPVLVNVFNLDKPTFTLEYVRNIVIIIMAALSTVNAITIMYYEKKM